MLSLTHSLLERASRDQEYRTFCHGPFMNIYIDVIDFYTSTRSLLSVGKVIFILQFMIDEARADGAH